jgi:hypothetical protein
MTTQAIVIRPCPSCFLDLADPDYPGAICGRCADELIVAEMKRREAEFAKAHRWDAVWEWTLNALFCVAVIVLIAALYGLLIWGGFEIGRHLYRLFE